MEERPRNWRYTHDELRSAVRHSTSYRQVLSRLGLSNRGGGAYATLHRRIRQLSLDTGHFTGQGWAGGTTGKTTSGTARPLHQCLCMDSPVTNVSRLKNRLIRDGLLIDQCQICGLPPEWNGQPMVLRMDHVNGDRRDNRIENLRLICPNCDSQLPTFAGRNQRRRCSESHISRSERAAAPDTR